MKAIFYTDECEPNAYVAKNVLYGRSEYCDLAHDDYPCDQCGFAWSFTDSKRDAYVFTSRDNEHMKAIKRCIEIVTGGRLFIETMPPETPVLPSPRGSPEHEAMLESLILLGLDPDHVEIIRTWPVTTLADFALSLAAIIGRARNEAIADMKAPKTA